MPRTFDVFDFKRELIISASQLQTKDACARQWVMSKRWKLPQEDKGYTIFGDVVHGIAERWLLADDTGRDPATGEQVDLYPDGWDIVDGRSGIVQIDSSQRALAKVLISKSIETGVLRRMPGREIEAHFQIEVIPGVDIIGFLDVALPRGVEDHKTSSAAKWLKTQKGLAEDTQMLIYAAVTAHRWVKAGNDIKDLTEISLRHNQMVKDINAPLVKATETSVSIETVEKFWTEVVVPEAERMLALKRAGIQEDDWNQIAGPKKKDTCRAYGGCPYQRICGGMETPAAYRKRMAKLKKKKAATKQEKEAYMGIFDRLDKKDAAVAAPAPAAEPEATKTETAVAEPEPQVNEPEAPAETPVEETAQTASVPPWALDGCKACRKSPIPGINSKGAPCRACDVVQGKEGGTTSEGFTLESTEDGWISWSNDGGEVGRAQFTGEAVAKKATEPAKPAKPAKKEEEPKEPVVAPPSAKKTTEPARRGPKPKGFTLLINAAVSRGKAGTIDLNKTFHDMASLLAKAQNADSYYALDSFKRKDWMAMKAEEIAATLGTANVVVSVANDDIRKFVAAIAPYAYQIFVGTPYA